MINNDLFYVCSLIEYTARITNNRRCVIVECLGVDGIKKMLKDASVNHCLTFEQVGSEVVEWYSIPSGTFDTISTCKYKVPSYTAIGKLYAIIVQSISVCEDFAQDIYKVFSSFISDDISDFGTDFYYQNPDYIKCCYEEGKILL